jgi:hypothetical protein
MSQQTVESVIGRLMTDEGFRRRFREQPAVVIEELVASGVPLTSVERRALLEMDTRLCDRFADCIDPRLQKVSLKGNGS